MSIKRIPVVDMIMYHKMKSASIFLSAFHILGITHELSNNPCRPRTQTWEHSKWKTYL